MQLFVNGKGLDLLIKDTIGLIMAGGLGKRMNSDIPKVLHLLKNKPLIVHVIESALKINPKKIKQFHLVISTL